MHTSINRTQFAGFFCIHYFRELNAALEEKTASLINEAESVFVSIL